MPVKKEVPYPCYDKDTHEGDLKLLQVCTCGCPSDRPKGTEPPTALPPAWRPIPSAPVVTAAPAQGAPVGYKNVSSFIISLS